MDGNDDRVYSEAIWQHIKALTAETQPPLVFNLDLSPATKAWLRILHLNKNFKRILKWTFTFFSPKLNWTVFFKKILVSKL